MIQRKTSAIAPLQGGRNTPFFQATLPLPPSINASYKIVSVPKKIKRGAAVYTPIKNNMVHRLGATDDLQRFKEHAGLVLNRSANRDQAIIDALHGAKHKIPLSLSLQFFYPTLWLRDIDGGIKAVQDALFQHLQINDNQIVDLHVQKLIDRDEPRVEVTVSLA